MSQNMCYDSVAHLACRNLRGPTRAHKRGGEHLMESCLIHSRKGWKEHYVQRSRIMGSSSVGADRGMLLWQLLLHAFIGRAHGRDLATTVMLNTFMRVLWSHLGTPIITIMSQGTSATSVRNLDYTDCLSPPLYVCPALSIAHTSVCARARAQPATRA